MPGKHEARAIVQPAKRPALALTDSSDGACGEDISTALPSECRVFPAENCRALSSLLLSGVSPEQGGR